MILVDLMRTRKEVFRFKNHYIIRIKFAKYNPGITSFSKKAASSIMTKFPNLFKSPFACNSSILTYGLFLFSA